MSSLATASTRRLNDEQRAIAELAFALGAKYADRRFDDHDASLGQWDELAASGLTGLSLPEEHGGGGGMLELCIASERLAAGGYPAAKLIISTAMAGSMIARHGTTEQRRRWLPGIAAGTVRFCFAFTEPEAGSNANNLRTVAQAIDGGFTVSGEKTYISALESSEMMIVVTRDAAGGLTLLVLPVPSERVTATRVNVEMAAFEHQWSVVFDAAEVPAKDVLGAPGEGGSVLFDGLNPERLVVASQPSASAAGRSRRRPGTSGSAWSSTSRSGRTRRCSTRSPRRSSRWRAPGRSTEAAAGLYDQGELAGLESNMAKIAACDAGLLAADRSLQVFGGSGYTDETMMLQRFTYMRLLRSIPVARELALNHVATSGLGLPRSY